MGREILHEFVKFVDTVHQQELDPRLQLKFTVLQNQLNGRAEIVDVGGAHQIRDTDEGLQLRGGEEMESVVVSLEAVSDGA